MIGRQIGGPKRGDIKAAESRETLLAAFYLHEIPFRGSERRLLKARDAGSAMVPKSRKASRRSSHFKRLSIRQGRAAWTFPLAGGLARFGVLSSLKEKDGGLVNLIGRPVAHKTPGDYEI